MGYRSGFLLVCVAFFALSLGGCVCKEGSQSSERIETIDPDEDDPGEDDPVENDVEEGSNPEKLADQGNKTIYSFKTSKKMLFDIFEGHAKTFYCGCDYTTKKEIRTKGCDYKIRKNKQRGARLEWEHVVPAAAFGRSFVPWKEGHSRCVSSKKKRYKGRRCAEKMSKKFRRMEADMYNLRPSVGEVNGDRSDKEMGIIKGEERVYGKCDVEISKTTVEPREEIRGDVARTYLYMNWAYPKTLNLSDAQKSMFEGWSAADPPDTWEKTWAKRVQKAQGNANPFVVGD